MTTTTTTTEQLNLRVAEAVASGWRVTSQTATMAIVEKGSKPNHVLHLLLSVFTAGLWLPVWAVMACTNRPERRVISCTA